MFLIAAQTSGLFTIRFSANDAPAASDANDRLGFSIRYEVSYYKQTFKDLC